MDAYPTSLYQSDWEIRLRGEVTSPLPRGEGGDSPQALGAKAKETTKF